MEIVTVTSHFASSVSNMFKNHGGSRVLEQDYAGKKVDLVVFTGGEDVHPRYYDNDWEQKYPEAGWYNTERDKWEMKVLKDIFSGKLLTKKVLGICRGHQLINVGMGGGLVYDIKTTYGFGHGGWHDLTWQIPNVFQGVFDEVNSMHHQGLAYIGEKFSPVRLAAEPKTGISEIVLWGDRFLGMQFHPEAMREIGQKGADLIARWITGEISIVKTMEKKVKEKNKNSEKIETPSAFFSTFSTTNAWNDTNRWQSFSGEEDNS